MMTHYLKEIIISSLSQNLAMTCDNFSDSTNPKTFSDTRHQHFRSAWCRGRSRGWRSGGTRWRGFVSTQNIFCKSVLIPPKVAGTLPARARRKSLPRSRQSLAARVAGSRPRRARSARCRTWTPSTTSRSSSRGRFRSPDSGRSRNLAGGNRGSVRLNFCRTCEGRTRRRRRSGCSPLHSTDAQTPPSCSPSGSCSRTRWSSRPSCCCSSTASCWISKSICRSGRGSKPWNFICRNWWSCVANSVWPVVNIISNLRVAESTLIGCSKSCDKF